MQALLHSFLVSRTAVDTSAILINWKISMLSGLFVWFFFSLRFSLHAWGFEIPQWNALVWITFHSVSGSLMFFMLFQFGNLFPFVLGNFVFLWSLLSSTFVFVFSFWSLNCSDIGSFGLIILSCLFFPLFHVLLVSGRFPQLYLLTLLLNFSMTIIHESFILFHSFPSFFPSFFYKRKFFCVSWKLKLLMI